MVIKMQKDFIYHMHQLPCFGCTGERYIYFQVGSKWVYYRDDPQGDRHRMKKNLFMSILEDIRVEPPKGSKGKDI